ncbi:CoA pyrophosphatase [Maritimibacter sp. DP1N21-5]|uniref:CoA pyrophosphatase n=1 Tax=Maritimibacter sp. DP1N21-5 TaxID=2836867 RepID=UPI001C486A70|nr:CoA pyrophosphatase [Maritimibacter sp. DP1N21-5]MBV7410994.1 CoA pyrophosphatase [Maritimibacter sp. DP1N21-5]
MTDRLSALVRACEAGWEPSDASSDFDLNPDFRPEGVVTRDAGVLVAFMESARGLDLILTMRSSALKHHPGQIAFPGGKVDPDDDGVIGAALREAHEEVGLDPGNVEVLGTMPFHETITSFRVTPVVARVKAPFTFRAEPGEVAEVFRVPFDHVMNPANYMVEGRMFRGRIRRYYTVPYGPYYIWGATARMLRVLADRVQ